MATTSASMDKRILEWHKDMRLLPTVNRLGVHVRVRCTHNRMATFPLVGRRIPYSVIREIEDDLSCCVTGGL